MKIKPEKTINILGVKVDSLSRGDVLRLLKSFLTDKQQHYLVTPNPEIILHAGSDEELFYILNRADLAPADAFGLVLVALLMGRLIKRASGADITQDLLSWAEKNNIKVGIFNWSRGLSSKDDIASALKQKYPHLNFAIEDVEREWNMPFYQNFNVFRPKIVFVALGSPWQEKFAYRALKKMPYLKLALSVGGSFDFLSGKALRAPKFFRFLGLEWFWRLLIQPKRIKRIIRATLVFPAKFFKWRFINPFLFRPAVSCLLFKETNIGYAVLLLKRNEEAEHWQLPQGGLDGQSPKQAGIRELSEELNNHKFKALFSCRRIYKYKYKKSALPAKQRGYKGQKLDLLVARFDGSDNDIKLNWWEYKDWRWIDLNKAADAVHPIRREATTMAINKFKAHFSL